MYVPALPSCGVAVMTDDSGLAELDGLKVSSKLHVAPDASVPVHPPDVGSVTEKSPLLLVKVGAEDANGPVFSTWKVAVCDCPTVT